MKASNAGIILGLVVVVILATVLAWFGLYSPALNGRSDAEAQTSAAADQNDILLTQLEALKIDYAQLPAITAELEDVRADLPLRQDLPEVRTILASLLTGYGVTLVNSSVGDAAVVDPAALSLVDAAAEVGTVPPSDGATFTSLVATPVTITIQGDYAKVEGFLTDLQLGDHRFLYVESSSITLQEEEDATVYTGEFNLQVFTFVNANVDPTVPLSLVDSEGMGPTPGNPFGEFTGSN